MTDLARKSSPREVWTSAQVYTLAAVCLVIGIASGWLVRGSQSQGAAAQVNFAIPPALSSQPAAGQAQAPDPQAVEQQAAPLLAQLRQNPENAELLAAVGNVYYDAGLYAKAIEYYQRSLRFAPTNANVRTDMATAYWYQRDADSALAEYEKVLSYEPTLPNALFNMGIVKWRGKMDVPGALAAWQKLLDTNPSYEQREKVQDLMTEVKKHSSVKSVASARTAAQ
jgi:cytochrome c-type biogenesis protein CcmH/NrfG